MKILVVYPYIPYPLNRGAYHRAFHLLKGLAVDHEVDLFALSENGEGMEHKPVFEEFCRSVRVVPFAHPAWQKLFPGRLLNRLPATIAHWSLPMVAKELSHILATGNYGAVHIYDIVLAQYFLDHPTGCPLIVDRTRVDLQYQLMEHKRMNFSLKTRVLNYENLLKLWAYEKKVARGVAREVVCGPDDDDFVKKYISRSVPVTVIPNGVDVDYFRPSASSAPRQEKPTLLFCGAMDYNPNVDALRWYFQDIHADLKKQIPDLQLLIVGKDPAPEVKAYAERPGVTVTGGVPDVRPYYRQAWMQMVPLRIGGGTRLKIVESLAMGTPVVSTTIGAQGLDLGHDFDILLADTAEAFVRETTRALREAQLRCRLEGQGIATVNSRLSWPKLARDLSQIYSNLSAPPPKRSQSPSPQPLASPIPHRVN